MPRAKVLQKPDFQLTPLPASYKVNETTVFSYNCPGCDRLITRTISYLDPLAFKDKIAKQKHSYWCTHCEARHEVSFILEKKEDGEFKLITLKLTVNDKTINKKPKLKK